jgi:hypothetical protein
MKTDQMNLTTFTACVLLGVGLTLPQMAHAHCDTMDGPVVLAAKTALEQENVTPVLMWVAQQAEPEIKTAFARALAVRSLGTDARELADQFFFETLVRVHRAGEGAPFTGLKPAGTPMEPAIQEADKALATGSVDTVIKLVTGEAVAGIRHRFARALEKQSHALHNVDAGREFVEAYVEYVHYVEGLHRAAQGADSHHQQTHNEPSFHQD